MIVSTACSIRFRMTYSLRSAFALRASADASGGHVGGQVVQSGQTDEQLLKDRLRGTGARAHQAVVRRDVAPANETLPFVLDDGRDQILDAVPVRLVMRQEDEPGAVLSRGRQRCRRTRAQERVGHLDKNACAVTGVLLASARAAMFQVDQYLQRLLDDVVRASSFDMHNESHAARIVFGAGAVQTLSGRGTNHSRN